MVLIIIFVASYSSLVCYMVLLWLYCVQSIVIFVVDWWCKFTAFCFQGLLNADPNWTNNFLSSLLILIISLWIGIELTNFPVRLCIWLFLHLNCRSIWINKSGIFFIWPHYLSFKFWLERDFWDQVCVVSLRQHHLGVGMILWDLCNILGIISCITPLVWRDPVWVEAWRILCSVRLRSGLFLENRWVLHFSRYWLMVWVRPNIVQSSIVRLILSIWRLVNMTLILSFKTLLMCLCYHRVILSHLVVIDLEILLALL